MSIKRISDLPKLPTDKLVQEGALDNTLFEVSQRNAYDQVFKSFSINGKELLDILIQAIVNIAIGNGQVNLTDVVYTNDKIHDQNITARKIFTVEQLFNGGLQVRDSGLQLYGNSSSLKFNPGKTPDPKAMLSNVVITGDELSYSYINDDPNSNRSLANVKAIGQYIDSKGYITNDDIASLVGDINGLQTLAAILNKTNLELYVDYATGFTINEVNAPTFGYVLAKINSSSTSPKIPLRYILSSDKKSATFSLLYFKNLQDAVKFANKFKFLEESKLTIHICRDMPIKALIAKVEKTENNKYKVIGYDRNEIIISHPDLITKNSFVIGGSKHKYLFNPPDDNYEIKNNIVNLNPNYVATLKDTYGDNDEIVKKIFFQGYLLTVSNKAIIQCNSQAITFKDLIFDGGYGGEYASDYSVNNISYYLIAMSNGGVINDCLFMHHQTPLVASNVNINGLASYNCHVGLIGSQGGIGQNIITEYICSRCGIGISMNGSKFAKGNGHGGLMYIEAKQIMNLGAAGVYNIEVPGSTYPAFISNDNNVSVNFSFNDTNLYNLNTCSLPQYHVRNIYTQIYDSSDGLIFKRISCDPTNDNLESYQNYISSIFGNTYKPTNFNQWNNYAPGGYLNFQMCWNGIVNSANYISAYTKASDYPDYSRCINNIIEFGGTLKTVFGSNRMAYLNGRGQTLSNTIDGIVPIDNVEFMQLPPDSRDVTWDEIKYTGACPHVNFEYEESDYINYSKYSACTFSLINPE